MFLITYLIPYDKNEMPDEVTPYYNEYKLLVDFYCKESQYFNVKFKVDWSEFPGEVIGLCQILPNSFKITIKKSYWDKSIDIDKFQLLSHELQHCLFREEHVNYYGHFMSEYQIHIDHDILYSQIRRLLSERCK